jgi:hypothetical protein
MRTQRRKYMVYSAIVAAASLLLLLGLLIAPVTVLLVGGVPLYLGLLSSCQLVGTNQPLLLWPLCWLLVLCQPGMLTLPTVGALRARGERVYLWLVAQFIVLVIYLLVNACLVLKPRSW